MTSQGRLCKHPRSMFGQDRFRTACIMDRKHPDHNLGSPVTVVEQRTVGDDQRTRKSRARRMTSLGRLCKRPRSMFGQDRFRRACITGRKHPDYNLDSPAAVVKRRTVGGDQRPQQEHGP